MPQRPAFVVHRLDRAANGLIIVAHEKKVAAALSAQFRSRVVEKHYAAVVHGVPHWTEFPHTIDVLLEGREAITHVLGVEPDESQARSLVRLTIETGRKHQIRQHLASAGTPVVGDRMYGVLVEEEDLQLSAYRLGLRCPMTGLRKVYQVAPGVHWPDVPSP